MNISKLQPVYLPIHKYLNRIRQTSECEIPNFHIGNQITIYSHLFSKSFQIVQHDNRTFIEPEILYGILDCSVFDIKSSITGQTCIK